MSLASSSLTRMARDRGCERERHPLPLGDEPLQFACDFFGPHSLNLSASEPAMAPVDASTNWSRPP